MTTDWQMRGDCHALTQVDKTCPDRLVRTFTSSTFFQDDARPSIDTLGLDDQRIYFLAEHFFGEIHVLRIF